MFALFGFLGSLRRNFAALSIYSYNFRKNCIFLSRYDVRAGCSCPGPVCSTQLLVNLDTEYSTKHNTSTDHLGVAIRHNVAEPKVGGCELESGKVVKDKLEAGSSAACACAFSRATQHKHAAHNTPPHRTASLNSSHLNL